MGILVVSVIILYCFGLCQKNNTINRDFQYRDVLCLFVLADVHRIQTALKNVIALNLY